MSNHQPMQCNHHKNLCRDKMLVHDADANICVAELDWSDSKKVFLFKGNLYKAHVETYNNNTTLQSKSEFNIQGEVLETKGEWRQMCERYVPRTLFH